MPKLRRIRLNKFQTGFYLRMAGTENRIIRKRIANSYLSSLVSISLVLFLVGVCSLLLVNTRGISDYFKENMTIGVMLKTEVSESEALAYESKLDGMPFIHRTEYISREQGEKEMEDLLGKDFLKVFESSPIPVSINVTLDAGYVSPDSVKVVENILRESPLVDEVVYQQSLVDSLNSNLGKITFVILVFIAVLMFISFVLINNTMRLSFYDKRFSVHTMKLVGATDSFIRRPFLLRAALMGLLSSMVAILMIVGLLYFVRAQFTKLFEVFSPDLLLMVMGIVVLAGVLICVVSTYFVVGRLVRLDKDDLYM